MMHKLRTATGAILLAASSLAAAQAYPSKPIRIVVNYPPGGGTDLVARTVNNKLGDYNNVTILVENRPSANGTIGSQLVARAPADGYTLMFTTAGHTSIPYAIEGDRLPFNPLRDFAPISMLVQSTQMIAVHPSLKVRTLPEFVKLAKSRPAGELSYASAGIGTSNHLGVELLKFMAGFDITHVPYKGGPQAVLDLTAGRVHLTLNSMLSLLPHVKSGKLTALAVGASKRSRTVPDVPTVAESGYPDYEVSTWYGMSAPAGTPRDIIMKLNADMNRALLDPAVLAQFAKQGVEADGGTPEALGKAMRDEYERWKKLIAAAKIQLD
jgi:tripartite-type tricarboxylate transporter receptor subunit TctC